LDAGNFADVVCGVFFPAHRTARTLWRPPMVLYERSREVGEAKGWAEAS